MISFRRLAPSGVIEASSAMAAVDRIVVDPAVLAGKPVVRGTRLSVDFLLGLLAQGWPEAEILRNYPGLTREDLLACYAYASERVREDRVYPFPAEAAAP
jgi:uncharacterized protein (DUF433 family)